MITASVHARGLENLALVLPLRELFQSESKPLILSKPLHCSCVSNFFPWVARLNFDCKIGVALIVM